MPWEETRRVRQHIKLDPADCNPDLDINPPKQYIVQIGTKRPDGLLKNEGTAYVYQPDGMCVEPPTRNAYSASNHNTSTPD